jgi:protocatechuate 3,4-dioxygenase, alpha subunit
MTSAIQVDDPRLAPTSSQTVGPFVEIGCTYLASNRVGVATADERDVAVRGRVIDGDGETVPDVMLEIWQVADHAPTAFARIMPYDDGSFAFHTNYSAPNGNTPAIGPAPHLAMLVFMRGLLKPVFTRMYFPGDVRNATDPVFALVPKDRRATLIAAKISADSASLQLEWNVVLQGDGETVFFEW